MAKEEEVLDKKEGNEAAETPPQKTKRDEYLDYISNRYPDRFSPDNEDEMYNFMLENQRNSDSAQEKMAKALTDEPRLAQLISDVIEGKRGAASAFVRYFGKDFLNAEEGTPEYEEIVKAETERKEELEASKASQAAYEKNVEESRAVFDAFASEHKVDINDFLEDVYNKIIAPIFDGKYTKEVLDMLYKALSYDSDVKDAFEAGSVKARNEKIEKMKKEDGDGLPKIGASSGPVLNEKKEPKRTFDKVRNGSVWDV